MAPSKMIMDKKNSDKIILDLCSGTGAWSAPYREAGYSVIQVTLPGQDVRDYIPPEKVYGILAAPPCDHFAISGARWFRQKDASGATEEGLEIVDACLDIIFRVNPVFWVLENPVGRLKKLRKDVLGEPTLIFNPCDFGDPWTKKTLLWGRFNLPIKNPVEVYSKFLPHIILSQKVSNNQLDKLVRSGYLPSNHKEKYGELSDRKTIRSITPPGFAQAFFENNR